MGIWEQVRVGIADSHRRQETCEIVRGLLLRTSAVVETIKKVRLLASSSDFFVEFSTNFASGKKFLSLFVFWRVPLFPSADGDLSKPLRFCTSVLRKSTMSHHAVVTVLCPNDDSQSHSTRRH